MLYFGIFVILRQNLKKLKNYNFKTNKDRDFPFVAL